MEVDNIEDYHVLKDRSLKYKDGQTRSIFVTTYFIPKTA